MSLQPSDMSVTSSMFSDGEAIPIEAVHHMGGGQNRSPDLSWAGAPSGTESFAVTTYDPDAPTPVGFVHWVLFNLDANTYRLDTGAGAAGGNPEGSTMGLTDFGSSEYGGPAPPPGPAHHYQFSVYALDARLDGGPTTTFAMLHFMMRGHVLAQGTLTGTFSAG